MRSWFLGAVGVCVGVGINQRSARAHESLTAYGVVWRTDDTSGDVVIRTNRGLIFRTQSGARLLCQEAIGAHNSEKLPVVSTEDGWLVGTSSGVVHLDFKGCPDEEAPRLQAGAIQAIERDAFHAEDIYVVTAEANVGSGIFRSDDDGATFDPVAQLEGDQFYNAVAFASDGEPFVYASGAAFDQETGLIEHFVETFADSGEAERHGVSVLPGETQIRVLNTGHESMLVQVVASAASQLPDRLLSSTTRGESWSSLIAAQSIHHVALAATGQGLFLATDEGLYESNSTGEFSLIPLEWMPSCVYPRGEEVVYCDALGIEVSTDPRLPETLMFFAEVTEPVSCDGSGQPLSACAADWVDFEQELPALPTSRPVVSNGDGGGGESSGVAGGDSSGPAGGRPDEEARAARSVEGAASGCTCGLLSPVSRNEPSPWWALPAVLWGVARATQRADGKRSPRRPGPWAGLAKKGLRSPGSDAMRTSSRGVHRGKSSANPTRE